MITKETLERISGFISPYFLTDAKKESIGQPWSYESHSHATDGRLLIRVQRIEGIASNPKALSPATIQNLFDTNTSEPRFHSIKEIELPRRIGGTPCRECDEYIPGICDNCGGTGTVPEEALRVPFGKQVVSHLYLHLLLELFPDTEIANSNIKGPYNSGGGLRLRFRGGDGILMPMRKDLK